MSQTEVPYLDLTTEFVELRDEWFAAIDETGRSNHLPVHVFCHRRGHLTGGGNPRIC